MSSRGYPGRGKRFVIKFKNHDSTCRSCPGLRKRTRISTSPLRMRRPGSPPLPLSAWPPPHRSPPGTTSAGRKPDWTVSEVALRVPRSASVSSMTVTRVRLSAGRSARWKRSAAYTVGQDRQRISTGIPPQAGAGPALGQAARCAAQTRGRARRRRPCDGAPPGHRPRQPGSIMPNTTSPANPPSMPYLPRWPGRPPRPGAVTSATGSTPPSRPGGSTSSGRWPARRSAAGSGSFLKRGRQPDETDQGTG